MRLVCSLLLLFCSAGAQASWWVSGDVENFRWEEAGPPSVTEKGARYRLDQVGATAKKAGGGWVLEGEKKAVLGAPMADKLVVSARGPQGLGLFLVEKGAQGVQLDSYKTLDEMRAADVTLKGVKAEALGDNPGPCPLVELAIEVKADGKCLEAPRVLPAGQGGDR